VRAYSVRSRTAVGAHPDIVVVCVNTVPAADDVDGAGGVDQGRVPSSASPRRAGRAASPHGTCGQRARINKRTPGARVAGRSINTARPRRDTHARTHSRTHTHTRTLMRAHTDTHTHKHAHARTHTHLHAHAEAHACTRTHTRADVPARTDARTHARTHACINARPPACPPARTAAPVPLHSAHRSTTTSASTHSRAGTRMAPTAAAHAPPS
jgi:hypothetical protein